MEWIKVEDRLPEMGKCVLVTTRGGFANKPYYDIYMAVYYPKDNVWMDQYSEYEINNVVAWQELPDVYVDPEFVDMPLKTDDNRIFYVETYERSEPNVPHYKVMSISIREGKSYVDMSYYVKKENAEREVERLNGIEENKNIIMYDPDGAIVKNITR